MLVVGGGDCKEILSNIFDEGEDDDDDEEDEEDEEEEDDESEKHLNEVTKVVDELHVCQLCPEGDGNVPFSIDLSQMNLMKYHFLQEHNVSSSPPKKNTFPRIYFM